MASASLYVREKRPSGKWRYRRIKEGRGVRTGDLSGPFYVRPFIKDRQVWNRLSAETFLEAKAEAEHLLAALDARSKGLTVAEADAPGNASRIPIRTAVEEYLKQKAGKAPKTILQYRTTLGQFLESLGGRVRFLDEITTDTLRGYKRYMLTAQGYSAKTFDVRATVVFSMLKKNKIDARIPRDEMPPIEEEAAVPYTDEELKKLFAAMDAEESLRYKFFLGTGCRDKEVTFAAWPDIDFNKKLYHVRRKQDAGFTPKSHESRSIPLPDALVALLRERHKNPPDPRWIFVNDEGRPDNHFLRKLKRIALHAGLNCGHCRTTITTGRHEKKRVEVSCKDQPVCEHFYLHRFRKTCATRWHEAGNPVRTIQAWLGHKDLETTQKYLGETEPEKLRGNINAAFVDY